MPKAQDTPAEAAAPEAAPAPAQPERNPAHPIGVPPGAGSWTWDIDAKAWRLL